MDEGELKDWLRHELKQPVPDWVWDLLRDDGFLHAEDEAERDDLLRRTRRLMQVTAPTVARRRPRPGITGERSTRPRLTDRETLRTRAVSEYFAKEAANTPKVRRFRAEVLGNVLLDDDQAQGFLGSEALRHFPAERFVAAGVPIVGHHSEILSTKISVREKYTLIMRLSPPGAEWTFERPLPSTDQLSWSEGRPLGEEQFSVGEGWREIDVPYWSGSVIWRLREDARAFEFRSYPWSVDQAIWFMLTGKAPIVYPLTARVARRLGTHSNRVTINISAEPWISAKSIESFYRDLQQELLGRANRPISELRLLLFRFVVEQVDDAGDHPTWRIMMERWNKHFPKRKYTDVRNMARDYWSAARLIAFPRFDSPRTRGDPGGPDGTKARKR
jgi:hypothetical protein